MLGLSIYLFSKSEDQEKTISMLKKDDYCFISLHHPCDMVEGFKEKALDLINRISVTGAKIITDIAPVGINMLGYDSFLDLAKANLVWGLRPDYGLSAKDVSSALKYTNIVINASCIDEELVENLDKSDTKFYAMHNFYPRPETGLDIDYCNDCTDYLHKHNCEVWAFISADDVLRGTVYNGLPTIEKFRKYPPYVQYYLLKNLCNIDTVFVGDVSLTKFSHNLILQTEKDDVLLLPAVIDNKHEDYLYDKIFTIRQDNNSLVARLKESRSNTSINTSVKQNNMIERKLGYITMDNSDYSVYCGEVQICLQDLCADKRVNVIGHVDNNYLPLLKTSLRNKKIMFVRS